MVPFFAEEDGPVQEKPAMLIIDGHVHIYARFDLKRFFPAAFINFAGAAESLDAKTYTPVMFLADWPEKSWFATLCGLCERKAADSRELHDGSFRIESTEEPISLIVRGKGAVSIIVIAARKIVTAENLEVMALFSAESFVPGKPLADTVQCIRDKGAIAVLPWAVGKWLGKRGRNVDGLLAASGGDVFLADNANRPWFWPQPRHFARAASFGVGILAGSDPLDLHSEADRAGRFGFALHGSLDFDFPARQLNQFLLGPSGPIIRYGSLETGVRFLKNQAAIRFVKKRRRANA